MEELLPVDCYNCKLLYPGTTKCGICGGSGLRMQPASTDDAKAGATIMKDALQHLGVEGGTVISERSNLIRALIALQLYGSDYFKTEKGLKPDSPEHKGAFDRLQTKLLETIRALDKL